MPRTPSDPARLPDDEDEKILCETIMALDMKESGQVGCAYYVAMDGALCLQEDIAMAGMEVVETLLLHAQPTTVIITNRVSDKLVEYLENSAQGPDGVQGMKRGFKPQSHCLY